jgi:cell fate (sporulation/competence/biofilm development) regulator YmcA (YheA/YmcA/DUF963 family)
MTLVSQILPKLLPAGNVPLNSQAKSTPTAPKHLMFLEKNDPSKNLEHLSSKSYSAAPSTGCMTREAFSQVPYFKPTPEAIHTWCIGLVSTFVLGSIAARLFNSTAICAAAHGDELNKNFFPITSECLAKSYKNLGAPSAQLYTFFTASAVILIGVTCSVAARIFLHDYKAKTRFALLNAEYGAIATALKKSYHEANDLEGNAKNKALHKVSQTAAQLEANLILIQQNLTTGAKLSPEDANYLISQLKCSINHVLNRNTTSQEGIC